MVIYGACNGSRCRGIIIKSHRDEGTCTSDIFCGQENVEIQAENILYFSWRDIHSLKAREQYGTLIEVKAVADGIYGFCCRDITGRCFEQSSIATLHSCRLPQNLLSCASLTTPLSFFISGTLKTALAMRYV